jgi:hypothetical protein
MPYQEFQENWKIFSDLIEKIPPQANEQINELIKKYIDQNIIILNDVFTTSIENVKHLQNAKSINEIICIQAQFTNDISKKISTSTQRFLNASLGHISDYNEWLKAHCDLATD